MSTSSAQDQWTVRRVLEWTKGHLAQKGSDTPRLDAEVLLAHVRGCARIQLYTRYDEVLTENERAAMRNLVTRRAAAEPVAYLIGSREFYSLEFRVTPAVLIPRPDTETLVMTAIESLGARTDGEAAPLHVLDLGTGSGCIAITIAKNCPSVTVTAVDLCADALAVAAENAETHGVTDRVRFLETDLFTDLSADEPFDLIVSNPPYVREDEVPELAPDIRLHEPHLALLAGDDGLSVTRRIVAEAARFLKPGGQLMLEHGDRQHFEVAALLKSAGSYEQIDRVRDLSGHDRVTTATRSA